jgi:hypothetical protein
MCFNGSNAAAAEPNGAMVKSPPAHGDLFRSALDVEEDAFRSAPRRHFWISTPWIEILPMATKISQEINKATDQG